MFGRVGGDFVRGVGGGGLLHCAWQPSIPNTNPPPPPLVTSAQRGPNLRPGETAGFFLPSQQHGTPQQEPRCRYPSTFPQYPSRRKDNVFSELQGRNQRNMADLPEHCLAEKRSEDYLSPHS